MSWKSKGLWTEKLTILTTTGNTFSPSIKWYIESHFCLIFKGSFLKQRDATFTPPNKIIPLLFKKLDTWLRDLNSDFTFKDWSFGGVKLAKNADTD